MKKKRILAGIGIFVLIIFVMLLGIVVILRSSYTAPQRVDTDGRLYFIEYKGDYYSPLITLPYDIIRPARRGGCSAFFTADTDGGHITGRNYDLAHLDPEGNLVTSELDLGGAYDESGLYILPAYGYEIIYGDGWNCIPSTGEYFYDSDRYPEDEPYPWGEYLIDGHFPWESEEMAGSLPIRGQSGSDSTVNPGGITFPVPAGAKTVEEANHMAQLSQGDRLSAEVLAQMQEEGRLSWEDFAPFQKWEEEAAAQAGRRRLNNRAPRALSHIDFTAKFCDNRRRRKRTLYSNQEVRGYV